MSPIRKFLAGFLSCLALIGYAGVADAVLKGSSGAIGVAAITSGTIDGTTIGGTTAAAVTGTTITANTGLDIVNNSIHFSGPATGTLSLSNAQSATLGTIIRNGAGSGANVEWGSATELLTLSTSGTTTDTTANLLPANSIIEAVTARITTTITTATNWSVGDATIAARFAAANATLTANTTSVGLQHVDQTGTSGPKQTAAAKVRITTTGTPGAGVIRITVFYRTYTPPTS